MGEANHPNGPPTFPPPGATASIDLCQELPSFARIAIRLVNHREIESVARIITLLGREFFHGFEAFVRHSVGQESEGVGGAEDGVIGLFLHEVLGNEQRSLQVLTEEQ